MRRDDEEEKRDCYGFKTNIIRDAIDNRERERERDPEEQSQNNEWTHRRIKTSRIMYH